MSELKHGDIDPVTGESVVIDINGNRVAWPWWGEFFAIDGGGVGCFFDKKPSISGLLWMIPEGKDSLAGRFIVDKRGKSLIKRYPNKTKRYYQLKDGKIVPSKDGMTLKEVRHDYLAEFSEYKRNKKLAGISDRDYIDRVNVAFNNNSRDTKLYEHLRKDGKCMTTYIKSLIEKDLHASEN